MSDGLKTLHAQDGNSRRPGTQVDRWDHVTHAWGACDFSPLRLAGPSHSEQGRRPLHSCRYVR